MKYLLITLLLLLSGCTIVPYGVEIDASAAYNEHQTYRHHRHHRHDHRDYNQYHRRDYYRYYR